MNAIFQQSDLMFLPSKSEGFPKVILEAASAGIPSVVYNTYGASNWMKHREDGFIVNNFDEVKGIVIELLNNSKLLQSISENKMKSHFSYFKQVFGISHFLIQENQSVITMNDTPLLLGVNVNQFSLKIAQKLRSIVFVGGLVKRKRID